MLSFARSCNADVGLLLALHAANYTAFTDSVVTSSVYNYTEKQSVSLNFLLCNLV
jgi:hypothetical protein